MEIHQILPTISPADAIGNEVIEIKKILNEWGYKSEIYAQDIHPHVKAKKFMDYESVSSEKNILIFHFSIGSVITDFIKNLPDKKIMIYHNVTPHEYFVGVNDNLVSLLLHARKELSSLADHIDLSIGVSEYNRLELQEMGFKNTDVLPIIMDFTAYESYNKKTYIKYDDEFVNILFVGRITPHKKQDDLLKVFYYYKKINPKSRLFLVGNYEGCEMYYGYLKSLIRDLDLSDVHLTGKVSFDDLLSYYKLADIFLCMSEHEGFCVPIIESMHFEIPIIAYNSTAIPYTLDNAGVLVNKKNYCEIAEMMHFLIHDKQMADVIIRNQKLRLNAFNKESTLLKLKEMLLRVKNNDLQ